MDYTFTFNTYILAISRMQFMMSLGWWVIFTQRYPITTRTSLLVGFPTMALMFWGYIWKTRKRTMRNVYNCVKWRLYAVRSITIWTWCPHLYLMLCINGGNFLDHPHNCAHHLLPILLYLSTHSNKSLDFSFQRFRKLEAGGFPICNKHILLC